MNSTVDFHPKDCLPPHLPRWPDEPQGERGPPLDSAATYWVLAAIGTGIAVVVLWLSIE